MNCIHCRKPAREGMKSCQRCADERELAKHEKRYKQKVKLINWLGGECKNCKLKDDCLAVYAVHHQEPAAKQFDLGNRGRDFGNWELIELELERGKCVLLCLNCHARLHAELAKVERENKRRRLANG
jgi:hypothetical protein